MRLRDRNEACSRRTNTETAAMIRELLRPTFACFLLLGCATTHAFAASSEWVEAGGGAVRLVTEGAPDETGKLRAALEIRLDPHWKTYWRDPGETGIPPVIDITSPAGGATVEIGFPVPGRFNDGYSTWVGYDHSVSLALTIDIPETTDDEALTASVLVGVCDDICIPLQADLGVELNDHDNMQADTEAVERAFAALPRAADDGFLATPREVTDARIVVETTVPTQGAVSLFVASNENWVFGTPTPADGSAPGTFEVPVFVAPDAPSTPQAIHYVLVAGDDAVAGTFEIAR